MLYVGGSRYQPGSGGGGGVAGVGGGADPFTGNWVEGVTGVGEGRGRWREGRSIHR